MMSMKNKVLEAQTTDWLTEGFSKSEVKSITELAKISARLEMKRLDLGMTQKEFAQFMGVSQGMISKWESRDYNFTIATLNEICERIGLVFDPLIKEAEESEYKQIEFRKKTKKQIQKINKYTTEDWTDQSRGIA